MSLLRHTLRFLCLAVTVAALLPAAHSGAATPYCGAVAIKKADGTTWQCTFDEEFNTSKLDTTKWSAVTTAATGLSYGGGCFVDSPNNIYVTAGTLRLVARKESQPFACKALSGSFWSNYTAGQVATVGNFSQTYGLFAVRAKFPATTVAGLQSSLWMWPQNYPQSGLRGEIDIAEEYSDYAKYWAPYIHYTYDPTTANSFTNTNVVTKQCLIGNVLAYHVYAVQWNSTSISMYEDDKLCLTDNLKPSGTSPFNQPFFVELTQALGTGLNAFNPAKTPLPATTYIDWVRAWK